MYAHVHTLHRRVTHHHLGETGTQQLSHRVQLLARHDGAADGGALLAGLAGHLTHHLLDEQLKLRVVGRHVVGQDGAVQRVGLGVERHAARHQVGVHPKPGRRVGRAGKRDHVLPVQPVQQIAGATDHQLQRALGQDAGLVDQAHRCFGQVAAPPSISTQLSARVAPVWAETA